MKFFSAAAGLVCVLFMVAACGLQRSYDVQGRVVGFGDDGRTVIVEHEEIPGLMPAMTMPFSARDTGVIGTLRHGDAVSFRLVLAGEQSWIERIVRLADDALPEHPAGSPDLSYRTSSHLVDVGEAVPVLRLLTHADTTMVFAGIPGKTTVLTFIYTRCPIPAFCPLMSQHFATLQPVLRERFGSRVHLVSVSLDPEFDTPDVLTRYATRYTSDLTTWTFATGDPSEIRDFAGRFGMFYRSDDDEIIHNLVTVAVGPEGTIARIWRGNEWTPEDVLEVVERLNAPS